MVFCFVQEHIIIVLEVKELKTIFSTQDGVVNAVNGISYSLQPGEALGT